MGSSVPIQTSKLKYWWICVVRFELLPQNIIKMIKALVGLALVAAVAGIPAGPPPPPYHAPAPAYKPAPYGKPEAKLPPQPFAYEYGVKDGYSGADFAKNENQDASGNVAGSYVVHLPDGRVQTVTYTADHYNGYVLMSNTKVSHNTHQNQKEDMVHTQPQLTNQPHFTNQPQFTSQLHKYLCPITLS